MDPIMTAQYGMLAAQQRFTAAGGHILQAANGDSGDLGQALVEVGEAKAALGANAEVFRTAEDMHGALLDIIA